MNSRSEVKSEIRQICTAEPHFAPDLNKAAVPVDQNASHHATGKFKGAPSLVQHDVAGHQAHLSQIFRRQRTESMGSEGEPASPVGSPMTSPQFHSAISANTQQNLATNLKIKELKQAFDFK